MQAYILVAVAAFAMISIAVTALAVTAVSRDTTARYREFFGLYDLAASGNEQAFLILRAAAENADGMEDIRVAVRDFVGFVCATLTGAWCYCHLNEYYHYWSVEVHFHDGVHDFSARTGIYIPSANRIYLETRIWRYFGNVSVYNARVRSTVFLDDDGIRMIELLRLMN